MKSIMIVSGIIFLQFAFSFTVHSQDIKLADIIKVECKDSTCFTSIINKKGFLYNGTAKNGDEKLLRYHSATTYTSTSDPKLKFPDFLQFALRKGQTIDIIFVSVKLENYLSLTNEMKDQGFVFNKFTKMEQGVEWIAYTSPTHPKIVMFTNYPDVKEEGEPCISYQVRLMRLL